ncbi:uncharacterized protein PRCAT00004983001 [Priceomyces carsonii]|uniref:uncharacterized protein n=1 Tax=Priceomyces carsonii TaxID=28549 RepID=UPI002EDA324B|nr:unnamed protein product [Priceomyces carsonii]
MAGGYIQFDIHRSLDGNSELPVWKWVFEIDFLVTIPVAAFGVYILPGELSKLTKCFFLNKHEFIY